MAYLFFKQPPIEAAATSASPSKQFPKPGRESGPHPQQRLIFRRSVGWRRIVPRRWTLWLAALAFAAVATQLSIVMITTRKLENDSSSSSAAEGSRGSGRIRLFEAFRHEVLDPRHDLRYHLRQQQDQQQQQQQQQEQHRPQHRKELESLAYERHHTSPEEQGLNGTALPAKPGVNPREVPARPNATAAADSSALPGELIHIVHTRFMQHQSNLTTLGVARLKQFLAFCLPTMVHQTTQDFLWIVKVDPLLESNPAVRQAVLEPLLEAVPSSSNIYVVASNHNFNMEGHGGSWRDGQEGAELLLPPSRLELNTSTVPTGVRVYTGDMARLRRAYELRERLPVLETRLDADDGLNLKYLERVQAIARNRFVGPDEEVDDASPKPQWLYWCILTQIEWHSEPYSVITPANRGDSGSRSRSRSRNATDASSSAPDYWEIRNKEKVYYGSSRRGYVVPVANENFCITPGLTVGYGVGTTSGDVPRYMHTALFLSLHDKYKFCHSEEDRGRPGKGPCLERMGGVRTVNGTTSYAIHALRSRTLTSAGMDGVGNIDGAGANSTGEIEKIKATEKEALTMITQHADNTAKPNNSDADAPGDDENEDAKRMESVLWRVLREHFAIDLTMVRAAQRFLTDHRRAIALENSLGQCSTGHSCKDKARERLRKIAGGYPPATAIQNAA